MSVAIAIIGFALVLFAPIITDIFDGGGLCYGVIAGLGILMVVGCGWYWSTL